MSTRRQQPGAPRAATLIGTAFCLLSAAVAIADQPLAESPISDSERSHWAFTPPVRPALPSVEHADWLRAPIDAFILAKLEAKKIAPAAMAPRAMLLRRLSLDLVGVPPTLDELARFEADQAPDALEREVDRLLAAPAFGERFGQLWLDLARFAETDGFEHDKLRPHAWRYRDWVIAALNADLPYDEFVRLQVAGDVIGSRLPGPSSRIENSALNAAAETGNVQPGTGNPEVATMFCLAGPDMPDINDQLERRHVLLNELTATVGAVFLGLQLGCAQCHDHKYDPLSQGDFYRLRAVFEPAVAALKRDVPFNVLAEQKDAAPARFWIRGDHRRPGPEVLPDFPRIASPPAELQPVAASDSAIPPAHAARKPGRAPREALANWLTHAANPLTSRVMANRLWQHHFGRGLCETPSDFGVMGGPVTHPELLDWLAVEFRERGWEMKRLHRMIVSSATYRQAGMVEEVSRSQGSGVRDQDPDNSLYSRFPRRRLEGEAIRDAMLAAADLLSTERGGPGVMPPLPQELLGTLLKGQWTASKREADHYKRSVYVFARRNLRFPIFEAFDRPDGNATCPVRNRSTTAPQSLLLLNSEFSLLVARHLAGRILAAASEPERQIEHLYRIALSRQPTPGEAATLGMFLQQQRSRLAAEGRPRGELALPHDCPERADPYAAASLVDACLAILNSNEFLYVD